MKKAVSVFVLFLLVLSIFSIAEETVVSAAETPATVNDCGFWCKINTFFFGSAENRAGKGWFDRSEALVGKE